MRDTWGLVLGRLVVNKEKKWAKTGCNMQQNLLEKVRENPQS